MALIKCSECGKQISDKAKTCPECGCPVDAKIVSEPDIDYSRYTAAALFDEAMKAEARGSKEQLRIAEDMHRYILYHYKDSNVSKCSKKQLILVIDKLSSFDSKVDINNNYTSDTTTANINISDKTARDNLASIYKIANNSNNSYRSNSTTILLAVIIIIAGVASVSFFKYKNNPSTALKRELKLKNVEVTPVRTIDSCYWFSEVDQSKIQNYKKSGFAKIVNGKIEKINFYAANYEIGAVETCKGPEFVTPLMQVYNGRASFETLYDNKDSTVSSDSNSKNSTNNNDYSNHDINKEKSNYGRFSIDEYCDIKFNRNNGESVSINNKNDEADGAIVCGKNEFGFTGISPIKTLAGINLPLRTGNGDELHIFHDESLSGGSVWSNVYLFVVINQNEVWTKRVALGGEYQTKKYDDIIDATKVSIDNNSNSVIIMMPSKTKKSVPRYKIGMGELTKL